MKHRVFHGLNPVGKATDAKSKNRGRPAAHRGRRTGHCKSRTHASGCRLSHNRLSKTYLELDRQEREVGARVDYAGDINSVVQCTTVCGIYIRDVRTALSSYSAHAHKGLGSE